MKTDRQIKQENQKTKKDKNTDVKEKNTFESKFSKGIFRASYFNPKLRSEFDIASEIIRYISKEKNFVYMLIKNKRNWKVTFLHLSYLQELHSCFIHFLTKRIKRTCRHFKSGYEEFISSCFHKETLDLDNYLALALSEEMERYLAHPLLAELIYFLFH